MRTKGKITFWNGEKGYGFITPSAGAKQVFAHISAFDNRNEPPQINQLVEFSLSTDKQGRPCAVSVTRAGERISKKNKHINSLSPVKGAVLVSVVVGLLGLYGYSRYQKFQASSSAPTNTPAPSHSNSRQFLSSQFNCDGRTHCSHMTSCDEAKYFIQNCPNTRMDGDGDGVPCESQWCD
jgi:cold shock CspA family protein